MDVNPGGWSMHTVPPSTSTAIITLKENTVDAELTEAAKNPVYLFKNKEKITSSIKELGDLNSTRYEEFMGRIKTIDEERQETAMNIADLDYDVILNILNETEGEDWANFVMASIRPIPVDEQKPIPRPDGNGFYTPKWEGNSKLKSRRLDDYGMIEDIIDKKCGDFLRDNIQDDEDFCLSDRPINAICRTRTDRCTTVYGEYQKEVVKIPNQPGDYRIKDGVTAIAPGAFFNNRLFESLIIPNSVTDIGENAFRKATRIRTLTLPNSITKIKDGTFWDSSSLESVIIPNSVTEIGKHAFEETKLKTITIPNSVTKIGDDAFSETKLETITIPISVTELGSYVFYKCLDMKSARIGNSITKIEDGTFYNCEHLDNVVIPNSVTEIEKDAFANCRSLKTILTPGSSLKYMSFSSIVTSLPSSVTKIGEGAFTGCMSIKAFSIPSSVTEIKTDTFRRCKNLEIVYIGNSVKRIDRYAFEECRKLQKINIPASVTFIDPYAFSKCYRIDPATKEVINRIITNQ